MVVFEGLALSSKWPANLRSPERVSTAGGSEILSRVELGIYTSAELSIDPDSSAAISPRQRLGNLVRFKNHVRACSDRERGWGPRRPSARVRDR